MDIFALREANDHSDPNIDVSGMLAMRLGEATRMPLRDADAQYFENAVSFRFGPGASRPAWKIGSGPVVILVHGYSGRGVQMAPLAYALAEIGFTAVFFDAGGHGAAAAEKIGFSTFMRDVKDLVDVVDAPIAGMIGHSAGGCAMMRARNFFGYSAERYVVISAPYYPYVPLNNMRASGAPEASLNGVKSILSDQFRTTWSDLVRGVVFDPEPGKPLLAIYDEADPMVQHTDAELISGVWPGTSIVKTRSYGHNKILKAPETIAAVRSFFAEACAR